MARPAFMGISRGKIPWTPQIDLGLCIGCGNCLPSCPKSVFVINKAESLVEVAAPEHCVPFCDKCADYCPRNAITFPDKEHIEELIRRLVEDLSEDESGRAWGLESKQSKKECAGQLEPSQCDYASEPFPSNESSAGWSIHLSTEAECSLVEQFCTGAFVMADDRDFASKLRPGDCAEVTERLTWIAREADRIVGSLSIAACNSQIARITMMCVEPRLRYSRLPTDLLANALRICLDAGVLKIVLSTHLPKEEAWKRFDECGYSLARHRERDGRHRLEFYLNLYIQADCERSKSICPNGTHARK